MNLPSLSLPDVLQEDFLTCSVCLKLYNTPKILPCLHSFCLGCLQQLVQDDTLICPYCRLVVDIGQGVCSLKNNFYINSLLELFKSNDVEDPHCAICYKQQNVVAAAARCLNCSEFLCFACTQGHLCSRPSFDHKVVQLKECLTGQQDAEARKSQEMLCTVHRTKPLKYFCDTCTAMICWDCRLLGHRRHTVPVADAADAVLKKRPELKRLLDSLSECLITHSEKEGVLELGLQKIKQSADGIRKIVDDYIGNITADLLSQKEHLLLDLDTFVKEKMEFYTSLKQELLTQKNAAVCTTEISQKVIAAGKHSELICLEELIRNQVREIQNSRQQPPEVHIPELLLGWDENNLCKIKHFKLIFKTDKKGACEDKKSQSIASTSRVQTGGAFSQPASHGSKANPLARVRAVARHSPARWGAAASKVKGASAYRASPARRGAAAIRGQRACPSRVNATRVQSSPVLSNPAPRRSLAIGRSLLHQRASQMGADGQETQQSR